MTRNISLEMAAAARFFKQQRKNDFDKKPGQTVMIHVVCVQQWRKYAVVLASRVLQKWKIAKKAPQRLYQHCLSESLDVNKPLKQEGLGRAEPN